MAEVELEGLWVHDVEAPTKDWHRYDIIRALTAATTVRGEVIVTASGRRIGRRRPGRADDLTVTLRAPRHDVTWLRDRAGQLLLWRDDTGQVVWGIAWEVPSAELEELTDLVDVRLTIDPITPPVPLLQPSADS